MKLHLSQDLYWSGSGLRPAINPYHSYQEMATRCKWCSITFASAAQLNQVGSSVPLCLRGSKRDKHLEADIKTHQYYCQKCKFTVRSFRALKEVRMLQLLQLVLTLYIYTALQPLPSSRRFR